VSLAHEAAGHIRLELEQRLDLVGGGIFGHRLFRIDERRLLIGRRHRGSGAGERRRQHGSTGNARALQKVAASNRGLVIVFWHGGSLANSSSAPPLFDGRGAEATAS